MLRVLLASLVFFTFGSGCHLHPGISDMFSTEAKRKSSDLSRPTIFAQSKKDFTFLVPASQVWDAAIQTLVRNYNLEVIYEKAGIITTGWDQFYASDVLMRNKLSLQVKKLDPYSCRLVIQNSVEEFKSVTWVPGPDGFKEVQRVVRNLASFLGEPKPVFSYKEAQVKEQATVPVQETLGDVLEKSVEKQSKPAKPTTEPVVRPLIP